MSFNILIIIVFLILLSVDANMRVWSRKPWILRQISKENGKVFPIPRGMNIQPHSPRRKSEVNIRFYKKFASKEERIAREKESKRSIENSKQG